MAVSDASQIRLSWPGKQESTEAPVAALQLVRAGNSGCELLCGDNLTALRALQRERSGHVTLAYLDPPFFTGKTHVRVTRRREGRGKILRSTAPAFDDHWESLPAYLQALRDRVASCRELLAEHGSLVLHVDPKTSHYAKIVCDEIFGPRCFASEIVWRYRRWPSKTPNFQRVHDVLLRWRKDAAVKPRFNQPYEPLAASTLATWGTNKQRAVFEDDGRRARSSTTDEPTKGVPMGDVWDIGVIAPVSRERTGYPSQKPEALLERIIAALSDEGEIVLDPYAGSGTTLAVAARLGRTFVGIDQSEVALGIQRSRLEAAGMRFEPAKAGAK